MFSVKLKVILLGDSEVGKTSIINQYINKQFIDTFSSIGIGNFTKNLTIKNKQIELKIVDTPGQDRFYNITKSAMRNTDIAILIYDITKKETFTSLKEWYKKLIEVVKKENIIIGIASNKSDLLNEQEIDIEEVKKFSEEINVEVFSTSATKYENIEDLFIKLTEKYCDNYLKDENINDRSDSNIILKNNDKKKENCKC